MKEIYLDIINGTVSESIVANAQDNLTNNYKLIIVRNKERVNLTDKRVKMVCINQKNKFATVLKLNVINAINGEVELKLTNEVTSEVGIFDCQIAITDEIGFLETTGKLTMAIRDNLFVDFTRLVTDKWNFGKVEKILESAKDYSEQIQAIQSCLNDVENTKKSLFEDEEVRKDQEQLRQAHYKDFDDAENTRVQSESTRIDNEKNRVNAENIRTQSESTREENEVNRKSSEENRNKSESDRVNAENARIQNEKDRISAETERKDYFDNTVKSKVSEMNELNENIKKEYKVLSDNTNQASDMNTELVANINSAKKNIDDLNAKNTTLTETVKNAKTINLALSSTIDTANNLNTTLTNNVNEIKEVNSNIDSVKSSLKEGVDNATSINSTLTNNISNANTSNTTLNNSLDNAKKYIGNLDISKSIPQLRLDVDAIQEGLKANQSLVYEGTDLTCKNTLEGRTEELVIKGNTIKDGDTLKSVGEDEGNKISILLSNKNLITLEESNKVTDYIPHKQYKKEILLPIQDGLKSLPNKICDTIEQRADGVYLVQKIGKIVLNGSEDWLLITDRPDTQTLYCQCALATNNVTVICDKIKVLGAEDYLWNNDEEGIGSNGKGYLHFRINRTRLTTQDINGLKAWLQANPITVYYKLATAIETKLDIKDLDLETFADITYITSDNAVKPTLSFKVPSNLAGIVQQNAKNVNELYKLIDEVIIPQLMNNTTDIQLLKLK